MTYMIEAIGYVRGGRADPIDDDWGKSRSMIELASAQYGPDALAGLDAFSHAEIIFLFNRVPPEEIERGARHPRGRADWPLTGIFAQRGKNRPNRLGVTVCRVLAVEGTVLHVEGLDAIDGTPVIDIKPVMREFLPRGDAIAVSNRGSVRLNQPKSPEFLPFRVAPCGFKRNGRSRLDVVFESN